MSSGPGQLAQRLWSLCDLLRDDGISNQDYLAELTWLLFLVVDDRAPMDHRGGRLTPGRRWRDLVAQDDGGRLDFYRRQLAALSTDDDPRTAAVFTDARTVIRHTRVLSELVNAIDKFEWPNGDSEFFGDIYEALIEKSTNELRSGAGQYFTPRYLIEFVVKLMSPRPSDDLQDPAAGTGGFLIAAAKYSRAMRTHQPPSSMVGVELVPDVFRLLSMNMLLHDVHSDLRLGDTLTEVGSSLPSPSLILSNPPFGTKRGAGLSTRPDLTFQTSNKQLMFLQHIYRSLKDGGRAAIVIPDGVLFESGAAAAIRKELVTLCTISGLIHLPGGLFYSTGVKTSILFINKAPSGDSRFPVYDARSNVNGKARNELEPHLSLFRSIWTGRNADDGTDRTQYMTALDFATNGIRLRKPKAELAARELDALLVDMSSSLRSALSLLDGVGRGQNST